MKILLSVPLNTATIFLCGIYFSILYTFCMWFILEKMFPTQLMQNSKGTKLYAASNLSLTNLLLGDLLSNQLCSHTHFINVLCKSVLKLAFSDQQFFPSCYTNNIGKCMTVHNLNLSFYPVHFNSKGVFRFSS